MKEVSLTTHRRTEFINIISLVQDVLARAGAGAGICFIYCPHTTAGLMINERADPAVVHDIGSFLEECVLENLDPCGRQFPCSCQSCPDRGVCTGCLRRRETPFGKVAGDLPCRV